MLKLKQKINAVLEHAEPNLPIIGLFGTIGYPLFYLVWKYLIPQPYENLALRLAEAVVSLPWLFHRHLPKKLKEFFPLYFVISVPVLLPFFFHYMMLKNEWSVTWAMSSMACLFLLVLIINDWLFICTYTLAGFAMAYAAVYATDGHVSYTYFQIEYIPTYLFAFFGCLIANHKRHNALQTKMSLMRSLSGSIAHEMRNPLSSITNALGTVQSIIPDKPDKHDAQQTFNLSYSCLVRIHEVIGESLSTIKRGNKIIDSILVTLQDSIMDINNFKKVAAKQTIQAAIANYGYNDMREKELIVDATTINFDFLGDKDLLIYVLFNLLRNALHYKDKPGFKIEITTRKGITTNHIRVRDTGPGIPQGKRELIFERFYTYGKSGGNGLGLSFCRRVVESFGGTITCDSEEGQWTEFIISLPAYTSKASNDLKREVLKSRRILIADDQISNRLLLTKFLSEWNCIIDEAVDGKQVVDLVAKKRYDLIFMDFEMPFITGDRAVSMMRHRLDIEPELARHYTQVPVIGITALPMSEALPRASACGMNEVLAKPLKCMDINKVLERYFFSEIPLLSDDLGEALSKSRILLVDDNETSRKFMCMILEHYGCTIGQADNGLAAIRLLEQRDFDLIVMDMEMPVMNGVETAQAIRKGEGLSRFMNFREIPIIALTGNTDPASIARVKDAGMNHFLSKPIFREKLVASIADWLNYGSATGETTEKAATNSATPSMATWEELCNEHILDFAVIDGLTEVTGNELRISLLEVFIREAETLIEALAQAASVGNLELIEQLSHTLKGSSGSMGAARLFVLSRHLNDLSRNGRWPDHENWAVIMKNTFEQTAEEMRLGLKIEHETNLEHTENSRLHPL
ncbi:MAG: response regulator [Chlorobiaceae bacterium]|nr:response regulator [Chlorobiaceae bacterium]